MDETNWKMDDIASTSTAPQAGQTYNKFNYSNYRAKLTQIREIYHQEVDKYEEICNELTIYILSHLKQQLLARPVTYQEIEIIINTANNKFNSVHMQLNQDTCDSIMILRTRSLDNRRKMRNTLASQILNEYFYSHYSDPYPSEDDKADLAAKCSITVNQISNWFGNKRNKSKIEIKNAQQEAKIFAAKKFVETTPSKKNPSPPIMSAELPKQSKRCTKASARKKSTKKRNA
ncbi:PREDICTED: homeobox protein extradenticle-like [Nicrophorus vespilloides]|uniref:Homeobox protein extradenticle-like n=1 Tax=Nicrophorus vespilloides TaxID=110193 RepID=A0ABM1NGK3_NICVS|nr:PREDICTED: homeobox protein extradenticle-like [Nicrophorus vespilloides]XP_017785959.1 PREDICTED: homeobox protein extradenticle-like [Nicrophorus vespilloides]XP_017785967.1 PREDICTED: homeobox protein extradenticle-like [Nicrophorus vespilloides]